jgi:hypothetical protein
MTSTAAFRQLREGLTPMLSERVETSTVDDVYRLDPLSHLDAGHVSILDLETKRAVVFDPYPHEVELIDAWVDMDHLDATGVLRFNNVRVEKSRQMGFSWTVCWVLLWAIMYHPVSLLALSKKLAEVDDGGNVSTPKSLFGRIRYMASGKTWPDWQRPVDYLHFRQGPDNIITNKLTDAFIVGRGQEDDPARGGTYHGALVDEAAFIEHMDAVERSLINAIPRGRLYGSTPNGEDNLFADMRPDVQPRAGFEHVRLHWTRHPVYSRGLHIAGEATDCEACEGTRAQRDWNPLDIDSAHRYPGKPVSPWYDWMVAQTIDEEAIAREIDISYERSLVARVYPEFSEDLHVVEHIGYDNNLTLEFSVDYGWSPSSTSIGIWQDAHDCLRKIGDVEVFEHTPEQVVSALRLRLLELGVPPMEVEPRFSRNWLVIGDPSGEAAEVGTGESLVVQYRKQGLEIVSRREGVRQTIIALKRLLLGSTKPIRYSGDTCTATIRHMKNNRWPVDRMGRRKEGASAPLNDEHNHMCFVAGTQVLTREGNVAIERIRPGSEVLTRAGWRSVESAGCRRQAPVVTLTTERGTLTGTADHPVWVVGKGWRSLDQVARGFREASVVVVEVAERDVAVVAEQSSNDAGGVVVIDVETGRPVVRSAATGSLPADGADAALLLDEQLVLPECDAVLLLEPLMTDEVTGVGVLGGPVLVGAAQAADRPRASAGAPRATDRDAAVLAVAGAELPVVRVRARCALLSHARIVNVEPVGPDLWNVYNLTVEGQPEFFANDMLVHNCRADAYYIAYKYPAPQVWEDSSEQSGFVMDDQLPYFRLSVEEARAIREEAAGASGDPTLHHDMRL